MEIAFIKCLNLKCDTSIDRISKKLRRRKMEQLTNEKPKKLIKTDLTPGNGGEKENTTTSDDDE